MRCNGNSASAALNKWLKAYTRQSVIHSFRQGFRDRLRAADIYTEFVDQLGGWAVFSVGQNYGSGHTLPQKHKALEKIVLRHINPNKSMLTPFCAWRNSKDMNPVWRYQFQA